MNASHPHDGAIGRSRRIARVRRSVRWDASRSGVRDGRRDVDDDVDDDDDDGDEDEDVDVETRRTRGARRRGEAKMRMRLESSVIHDDESKRSDPRS